MTHYTPTTNEIRADFITLHTRNFDSYTVGRSLTSEQEVYGDAFDRMIAEVERAAAVRALEGAAEEVGALTSEYTATAERLSEGKEWADSNRYFGYASGSNRAAAIVRARAAEIREGK